MSGNRKTGRRDRGAGEGRERSASLLLERGKDKLDVLAGPQFVGSEIGAGAKIVARLRAANGDSIDALRLPVADAELREEWLRADIL